MNQKPETTDKPDASAFLWSRGWRKVSEAPHGFHWAHKSNRAARYKIEDAVRLAATEGAA